jgi:hypothetical protein
MWRRGPFWLPAVALLVAACTGAAPTPGATAVETAATTAPGTAAPTIAPTEPPTPAPTPVPTEFAPHSIEETTMHMGVVKYDCDENGCWRQGSGLADGESDYYPSITADNPEIATMLADIGLPATRVASDKEAWERLMMLWDWFSRNAPSADQAQPTEALTYLMSLSYRARPPRLPTMADMAKVYARYHVVPWFACTAASLQFVAIAYRVGIDPDRIATAFYQTKDLSIQHVYPIVRSGDHWYYVDAVCNVPGYTQALPTQPANVGCLDNVDYVHPTSLAVLPGSTLTRAPLIN